VATRSSYEASAEVTQSPLAVDPSPTSRDRKKARQPRGLTPGKLVAFTRHPTWVRTAMVALHAMRLRGSDHVLMSALILACDREGVVWPKPAELVALTGLALNTVLASLRRLRKIGLLDWRRLRPFADKWPKRVSYEKPVQLTHGTRSLTAEHGGRVFVVRWEKLGVPAVSRDLARKVEDRSKIDRSGSIPGDRSSDPSDLTSFDLKNDPAPSSDGCGSAPPSAANVEPLQSRGELAAARAVPPTISRPAQPPGSSSSPAPAAAPSAAIARAVGEGASENDRRARGIAPRAPHTTPTERVTAAQMAADLARRGIMPLPGKP
jgi:hypothetical protein